MAVPDRSERVHAVLVNRLLKSLVLLALGGVLILNTDPVVGSRDLPSAITGVAIMTGLVLGYVLTVWGLLILTRSTRWERPGRLALVAVGLLVLGIIGHNVVSAVIGVEEAVFFLLGVWIAPGLLIAALVRVVRRPPHHSQPTGMGFSAR